VDSNPNPHPDCQCCSVQIEYMSKGIHWGLCISCFDAVQRFIYTRRENFKKRGLIKK